MPDGVQAMASQSLAYAKSPIDFVSSFGGRMQALARAHDLLTRTRLQGAKVLEIVRDQVVLGADDTGSRTPVRWSSSMSKHHCTWL
jgi:two-component sensor histidine kinase